MEYKKKSGDMVSSFIFYVLRMSQSFCTFWFSHNFIGCCFYGSLIHLDCAQTSQLLDLNLSRFQTVFEYSSNEISKRLYLKSIFHTGLLSRSCLVSLSCSLEGFVAYLEWVLVQYGAPSTVCLADEDNNSPTLDLEPSLPSAMPAADQKPKPTVNLETEPTIKTEPEAYQSPSPVPSHLCHHWLSPVLSSICHWWSSPVPIILI